MVLVVWATAATAPSSDRWTVAVAAFAAAGFGAAVGGGITWWLQRGAWLRRARADIYRGVLHEVHDWVNDVVVHMKTTNEPQGPPVRESAGGRQERLVIATQTCTGMPPLRVPLTVRRC